MARYEELKLQRARRLIYRERLHLLCVYVNYSDIEFRQLQRYSREGVKHFGPQLQAASEQNKPVSAMDRFLIV